MKLQRQNSVTRTTLSEAQERIVFALARNIAPTSFKDLVAATGKPVRPTTIRLLVEGGFIHVFKKPTAYALTDFGAQWAIVHGEYR